MKRLGMVLGVVGVIAVMTCGQAFATVDPNGTFGFSGFGLITLNTGDITAGTTAKTLPILELVNTVPGTFLGNPNNLGISLADVVTLSYLTLPVPSTSGLQPLATALDITVTTGSGPLTFRFTDVITLSLTPTTGTGGSFSVGFQGTLFADGTGTGFTLGTPATFSESCSQSQPGGTVNCSETIATPSTIKTPEPATLLLLGSGLLGVAVLGRRFRGAKS